jgi:MFS transporter, MHS family, proline/betaine transporter
VTFSARRVGEQEGRSARVGRTPRAVIAAVIGNLLEWFDFAVYGYFALVIGKLFFPSDDETTSLLLAVATFGAGFVMRPVGAVLFGSFADTRGRKAALSVTILLMSFGTVMIGLAPTYAMAGAWAPAWIVVARLIQGLSAGGEVGGATAFLVEHAPVERRGYFASWQQASVAAALLLGSLAAAAITGILSSSELQAWGWRIPFLCGFMTGPAAWYIRSRTEEGEEFQRGAQNRTASPLRSTLATHRSALVAGFGVTIVWTVCTYFYLLYMPTYAVRAFGLEPAAAMLATGVGLIVLMVLAPVFGALSDSIGRIRLLIGFAAAILIATYPALWWLARAPSTETLMAVQVLFGILIAGFAGPAPAAMAEIYPPEIRSTGISVAYNFAVTIFGGFTPFVTTWLIARSGSALAPAWYVMFAAALSLCILAATRHVHIAIRPAKKVDD